MDTHHWDISLDPEIVPLFLHLQWAHRRSLETMRPDLLKSSLTTVELDVLATLRNAPAPHELTPSRIQEEVVITSGGLTGVLLHLEERGLVERYQSPQDLRVKPVRLTAAGVTHIEEAMTRLVTATGQWLRSRLDSAAIGQLTDLLRQLTENDRQETTPETAP